MSTKKRGLVFLMNEYPKNSEDTFIRRKKYRFVPTFIKRDTIILIEIYNFDIIVISFYDKKLEDSQNKFRERFKFSAAHVRSIFKACLDAFYENQIHKHQCALVFHAANNIGEITEDNARYSAYNLFLNRYLEDYNEYERKGSLSLNTLMLYHGSHRYQSELDEFYSTFADNVNAELNEDRINIQESNIESNLTLIEKRKLKQNK